MRLRARVRGGGDGKKKAGAWADATAALKGFLADPWPLRPADGSDTGNVQVQVEVLPLDLLEDGEDEAHMAAMQRQAAAAEDGESVRNLAGTDFITYFFCLQR